MTPEMIDPTNPVVALCAEGMAAEGTPAEARRLFERAWEARRDDYDAAIAAHFLARHQPNAADTLHWNALAVRHAEAVPGGRAAGFLASLYLNLGDAHASAGDHGAAAAAVAATANSSRWASTGLLSVWRRATSTRPSNKRLKLSARVD